MKIYIIAFFIFFLSSCNKPKNDKIATIVIKQNQTYIQLTGKRIPLTHDPVSMIKNNLIDDTLLLKIPYLKNGVINGKDIYMEEGYYKYAGSLLIKFDTLIVNLFLINTDKKKLVPESYNGRYILSR